MVIYNLKFIVNILRYYNIIASNEISQSYANNYRPIEYILLTTHAALQKC